MPSTKVSQDKIAFAVVSCGPYARTYKAETFIESLCKLGGWEGRVFLFTEQPACFDLDRLRKLAGNERIEIVQTEAMTSFSGFPVVVEWTKRGALPWPKFRLRSSRVMNQAKTLKARLFEFCPDKDVEVLIFSDADSIVIRNDQMPALMALASQWTGEGIKCRLDRHDRERPFEFSPKCRIHSGLLILHRELSKRALTAWKNRLLNNEAWKTSPFDRDRFREAYDEVVRSGVEPNYMEPEIIPRGAGIEGFSEMQRAHMIEHISFGRLRANGRQAVEDYVSSFDLKSYPRGYYFLGPTPEWIKAMFYLGFFPSSRVFKIEDLARRIFGARN